MATLTSLSEAGEVAIASRQMAKLTASKCPHCGAPVNVAPDAEHVTCGYCHHSSSIQRGRPPRGSVQQGPVIHVSAPSMPGHKWLGLAFLLPILGSLASVGVSLTRSFPSSPVGELLHSLPGAAVLSNVGFSDQPLLFDVNEDGIMDILGKSDVPGAAAWIAAYDGRDGKELWRSAELTKEAANGIRGLSGDTLVSVDELGKVQAYNARTGQPAWAALLGEQARGMCHGEGFVRITTSDRKNHELSLTTGQALTGKTKAPCRSIPCSRTDGGHGYRIVGWSEFRGLGLLELRSIDGMANHRALVPDQGRRYFMLGSRSPGSQVAMVAGLEGKKVLWKTLVPAVDPLTTDVNVTTQIAAYSGDRIFIPYDLKGSKGVRMAAFDTNTGTRLWDVPVHDKSQVTAGIAATEKDVYFASWTALYALRADTGELRFRVGKEF